MKTEVDEDADSDSNKPTTHNGKMTPPATRTASAYLPNGPAE